MDDQQTTAAGGTSGFQGAPTPPPAQTGGSTSQTGPVIVSADDPTPVSTGGAQTGSAQTGAQTGTGAGQTAGDDQSYLRPRPPDHELGIGAVGDYATSITCPAHPNTTFDEQYFLKMLSGSISLTKNEKKKIVESISKLSQYQIDELIKIFEEERRKFAELDEKHQVKIRELQQKQIEDWRDLELEEKQQGQKGQDEAAAAALRAKLMGAAPTDGHGAGEQNKAA
ncbi:MAG: hypothetical protein Q8P95_01015 [bacterium]|nr:hypothetical protein [bacterium]